MFALPLNLLFARLGAARPLAIGFICVLCAPLAQNLRAQSPPNPDSLWNVIRTTRVDTIRARTYYRLGKALLPAYPDSAWALAEKSQQLGTAANDAYAEGMGLRLKADVLMRRNEVRKAAQLYLQSARTFERGGFLWDRNNRLNQLGSAYHNIAELDSARYWYERALQYIRQGGDSVALAGVLNNLANVHENQYRA